MALFAGLVQAMRLEAKLLGLGITAISGRTRNPPTITSQAVAFSLDGQLSDLLHLGAMKRTALCRPPDVVKTTSIDDCTPHHP
jgi:hypothetical protein